MLERICMAVTAGTFLALSVSQAAAAPILMTWDSPGNENDCAGLFGGKQGTTCDVGNYLNPATPVSPWIAKFDKDENEWEVNDDYGSITGAEFTINQALKTWSYTPGPDDRGVRFWVAKGGNQGFRLHWMVEEDTLGNACDVVYSLSCLSKALVVTEGIWDTPTGQGLSHMTFYNGGIPTREGAEPTTLLLLGAGGAAAAFTRRRR